jgi:hypothetical protein
MKIMTVAIALLLLCFYSGNMRAQQLQYDIIWLGKVGKLKISKTQEKLFTLIETNSEVKIPFYKLNWVTSATMKNGQLWTSNYAQLLNDKRREFTDIAYVNDSSWQKQSDAAEKELIKIDHKFNVSDLYFEEPVNQNFVFSERFGKTVKIVDKGDGHYRLLLPDGNHCDFFYEEGICTNVKAKNGSRTIKFVLRDNS